MARNLLLSIISQADDPRSWPHGISYGDPKLYHCWGCRSTVRLVIPVMSIYATWVPLGSLLPLQGSALRPLNNHDVESFTGFPFLVFSCYFWYLIFSSRTVLASARRSLSSNMPLYEPRSYRQVCYRYGWSKRLLMGPRPGIMLTHVTTAISLV